MDEQKFEKTLKDAKWFAVLLLIFNLIALFVFFASNTVNWLTIVIKIFQLLLMLGAINGLNKRLTYGPICGVILSILMILSFSLLDIIFGILYLIECITLIRYMNN